jgi:hypothetical protein
MFSKLKYGVICFQIGGWTMLGNVFHANLGSYGAEMSANTLWMTEFGCATESARV